MNRRRPATVLTALWATALVDAQPPCNQVTPTSTLPYADHGNRCEGFYRAKVSGSLELVSFTLGEIAPELRGRPLHDTDILLIQAPQRLKEALHVRAESTSARVYYRMDALVTPGGRLEWPAKDVLSKARMDVNHLGVVTWVVRGGKPLYIPVAVRGNATVVDGRQPKTVRLILRPPVDIDSVSVRRASVRDGECTAPQRWESMLKRPLPVNEAFSFALKGGRPGLTCIDIRAHEMGTNYWPGHSVMADLDH